MVQLRKLARYKRLIGQSKKPNPEWRQWDGLLRPPKLHPTFERGYPQFEKPFDPANRLTPASQRKWRPPPQPRIVSRNSDDYNQDNLHELKSKFQFEEQDASAIVVRLVELEEEEWVRGMKRKKDTERDLQKEERE
eukprot:s471_g1.t1